MFEIEVFSDPLSILAGLPASGTFEQVRLHDEELLKPALLLSDHAVLSSHRVDLLLDHELELSLMDRRVPVLRAFQDLSKNRSKSEISALNLRQSALMDDAELKKFEELERLEDLVKEKWDKRPRSTNPQKFEAARIERDEDARPIMDQWAFFWRRSSAYRVALEKFLSDRVESIRSPSIYEMTTLGLVTEKPWDKTIRSRPRQIIDREIGGNAAYDRAYLNLIDEVTNTRRGILLDDSVQAAVSRMGREIGGLESAHTVRGAVDLMKMVEGVASLPIDEVIDVRSDLVDYIAPFRSFLLDISSRTPDTGEDPVERYRQLSIAWEREVEPAIAEMRAHLESASFKRQAMDVMATSNEALKTVGMAIGVATAAGFAGFSTLTAAAAVGPPLLKSFIGTVRARQAVVRDRVYFVHALDRRLRKLDKKARMNPKARPT